MRLISAILVALLPSFAWCNDLSHFSHFSYVPGKAYVITFTREDLAKTPAWHSDAENPPLSARKAITLADALREKLVKDSDEWHWMRAAASIQFDNESGRCYWLVRYEAESADGVPLAGSPPHLRLVVLMDGTILKPKVHDK